MTPNHPSPLEFAEGMFMFYAGRLATEPKLDPHHSTYDPLAEDFCHKQALIYYTMIEENYPFFQLINDWGIGPLIRHIQFDTL